MLQAQSLQRRSWVSAGWLIAIVFGVLLAVVNIYAGVLFAAIAALGATVAMLGTRIRPSAGAFQHSVLARDARPAITQRAVYTADGISLQAIVVPVSSVEGYTMVLTTDGYKLVNAQGQVVYSLRQ